MSSSEEDCTECCQTCEECSDTSRAMVEVGECFCPINICRAVCIEFEDSLREDCPIPWCNQVFTDIFGESVALNTCPYYSCLNETCEPTGVVTILSLLNTLLFVFLSLFLLGILQSFDSRGPPLLTFCGSIILAVGLSGFQFNDKIYNKKRCLMKSEVADSTYSKVGRFTFRHSHHCFKERENGHEIKIGNKFFCIGCYGIFIGTIVSIFVALIYIFVGIPSQIFPMIIACIPICFTPIILRYTLFQEMRPSLKLLANSLLPIGCCFIFLVAEHLYHNWLLNVSLILVCIIIAFLRALAPKVDRY